MCPSGFNEHTLICLAHTSPVESWNKHIPPLHPHRSLFTNMCCRRGQSETSGTPAATQPAPQTPTLVRSDPPPRLSQTAWGRKRRQGWDAQETSIRKQRLTGEGPPLSTHTHHPSSPVRPRAALFVWIHSPYVPAGENVDIQNDGASWELL